MLFVNRATQKETLKEDSVKTLIENHLKDFNEVTSEDYSKSKKVDKYQFKKSLESKIIFFKEKLKNLELSKDNLNKYETGAETLNEQSNNYHSLLFDLYAKSEEYKDVDDDSQLLELLQQQGKIWTGPPY